MEIDALREELLRQHQDVRRLLTQARRLSSQIARGGAVAAPANRLRNVISELNQTLDAHWTFENGALQPILGTLDAWGAERVKRMETDHRAEHLAMASAMELVENASTPQKLAAAARAMSDELLSHIEDEEKYLLARNVLTAEIVRVDQPID